MALSIRKKKQTTALVPFSPEAVMQGEPSLQTAKLDMLLQVLALFIQPMWKQYQPYLSILKLAGMDIPDNPQELISAVLLPSNDELMKNSINSACEIMKAVVDEAVSQQDFEEILLRGIEIIRVVNSTKVEEVHED